MLAFRASFKERDSGKVIDEYSEAGERIIAGRRTSPRSAIRESVLKEELADDLSALLNTVNLESIEDLEGLEEVRRSILNYGIDDLTAISADSQEAKGIAPRLQQILRDHEDRLVDGSVRLAAESVTNEASARIAIHINAEMYASPTDVPVEFVADVESYSGKVRIKQA